MEQIIITHLDGSTVPLQSRGTTSRITRATQTVQLLGNDTVDITIESAYKMTFAIGDKITIVGRDYTMNIPAKEKKVSANHFQYDLQFEGVQYDLLRATYDVNIDTTGSDIQGDSLTGDMKRFLDVLIANISQIFPGKWVLGTYPVDTEAMTLTFGETDNCLSVLQTLCGKYNQEFDIAISANGTRTINIGQAGKTFGFTFQYGRGRGIYDLTREKVSSSNIVTRLNVFGSTKNITSKYRSTKLLLPGKTKPQSFLEDTAAISKYGVWKNTKNFDSIFPHRIGIVSALGDSVLKFIDTSMTFDLNEKESDGVTTKYLLSGTAAKVHFNTGQLAGYEFDIHSYDHATKTFKIKSQTDENDYTFPSETSSAFQIGVGDEYVLLDIALPQSYVDTAEAELLAAGTEYLAQNCQPKVQYSLTVDKFFLASVVGADAESNVFWVGDYIPIKDADIDVDKSIRIKGFTRDLMTDYSYSLTIADLAVTKSAYSRIISDLIDIDKVIKINNMKDPARARRNYLNAQEVLGMVFDPEGDYYTDKIKPESVDTVMLSVGAKSMQFGLVGTVFQPNYGGNKNRIVYKGGVLTHYAIVDANKVPRSWTIDDGDQTLLTDAQPYYIYAKCEKNDEFGSIIFSKSQIAVESDPLYYHFWVGIINSVDIDLAARSISLMYGFTTINGGYIKTGRIDSADGETYFDLDGNKFRMGNQTAFMGWNIDGNSGLKIQNATIVLTDSNGKETVRLNGADGSGSLGDVISWGNGLSNIANFIFQNQKMVSQAQTNSVPNLSLDGLTGLIKMLKAEIGRFKVVDGDIIGFDSNSKERIRFSANLLPAINSLNQGWTILTDGFQDTTTAYFYIDEEGSNSTYQHTYETSFTTSEPCNVQVAAQGETGVSLSPTPPSGEYVIVEDVVQIYLGNELKFTGTYNQSFYASTPGNYTVKCTTNVTMVGMSGREAYEATVYQDFFAIMAQTTPEKTFIGSDGLYSIFSGGEYIYFKNGYGFEAKAGNYGLQITTAGVKKWNGSSWVLVTW